MKYSSLSKIIWLKTLPWLISGLVIIVGIQFFLAQSVIEQRASESHKNFMDLVGKDINNFVNNSVHQTQLLSENAFIINGLIDNQTKNEYIPIFFGSFNLSSQGKAYVALVDYKGRLINANDNEVAQRIIQKYNWEQTVLNQYEDYINLDESGLFIVSPVIYSSVAEGAVVSFYPMSVLEKSIHNDKKRIWSIFDSQDNEVLFSPNYLKEDLPYYDQVILNDFTIKSFVDSKDNYKNIKVVWFFILFTIGSILFFSSVVMYFSSKMSSEFFKSLLERIENRNNGKTVKEESSIEFKEISHKFKKIMGDLNETSLSKNKILSILNSMDDVIFVVDFAYNLKMNNDQFHKFKDECNVLSNQDLLKSSDAFYNKKNYTKDICHYIDMNFDERIMSWSKQYLVDENDQHVGYIFVGEDVTKEFAVAQEIRIINKAISELPNGLIITNNLEDENPIIYANQAFLDITGYDLDEVMGRNCRFLQGEKTDNDHIEKIKDAIKDENNFFGVIKNYKKNGDEFWNDLKICPIKNKEGAVTHFVGMQMDVSNRIKQEEQLVQAKINAEASTQLKSEFLANMSHEIRTPMNGIIGTLNILKKQDLTHKQTQFAQMAETSANSLLGIINDILDFSKIEAGKLEIENIEISLYKTIVESIQPFILKAKEANIELSLNIKVDVLDFIISDPTRIRQVITNLLSNALKFTSKNKSDIKQVSIHVTSEASKKGQLVSIGITDTGIGIPEEKLHSLFDKFTQVDASTTRNYGGTGLGLSIVQQLSQLMGGDISVESEVNKGSTFTFSMDVRNKEKQRSWANLCAEKCNEQLIIALSLNHPHKDIICQYLDALNIQYIDYENDIQTFDYIFVDEKFDYLASNYTDKMLRICNVIDFLTVDQVSGIINIPVIYSILDIISALNIEKEKKQEAQQKLNKQSVSELPLKNKRILLVEDNGVNQIVAQTILEEFGCIVSIQDDGQQAVDLLNNQEQVEYDLILMDCQMPVLDGYEATIKIRKESKLPEYQKIIIIAMTANVMKGDKEKCLQSGMDDYIAKPIDENALLIILQKWLNK